MKKFFVVLAFSCAFFLVSCDNGSKMVNHGSTNEDADFIDDSDETDTTTQSDDDKTHSDDDFTDTVINDGDSSDPADDADSNDEDAKTDDDTSDTQTHDNDSEEIDDNNNDADTAPDDDPVVIVEGLDYESGFIDLEENSYTLSNSSTNSGRAKMWYDFQPADENPESKPLFVLYNGGPGSSSWLIFLYNTSKKTAVQAFAGEGVADNQWNWNKLGNLL